MSNSNAGIEACPVATAQKIIGGKWTVMILYHLGSGTLRFGELNRLLPSMTQATLTKELRSLENYKIIKRKVYPEVPPRVEYSLTEIGVKLLPALQRLAQWGDEYKQYIKGNRN